MAGIYIHIPFCRQACHYCNFHFSTSLHYRDEMVNALRKEIHLKKNYTGGEPVHTVYFGGGTPSLLPANQSGLLLQEIRSVFPVDPGAEITLEVNPDDVNMDILAAWKKSGFNRLSMGVQSFYDDDLQWMNRAHHSGQALEALKQAMNFFENITIDLIYGSPGLTMEKWKHNLEQAVAFGVPHLSCYALTVEPATPLDKMIRLGRSPATDPEQQAEQFEFMTEFLGRAGYEHYEISSFALPGKRSRHNSAYWRGETYAGIGPGAHSYNGTSRQWNVANNTRYTRAINENQVPAEIEILTPAQQRHEYIMTALRTREGMSRDMLENKYGGISTGFTDKINQWQQRGLLEEKDGFFRLTQKGKLFADGIAADLFD